MTPAPHRRAMDADPRILMERLNHIERMLETVNESLAGINGALIGSVASPGFVAQLAAHGEAIEAHKRNFRLIAGTFIAQIITLLGWSLTQLYSNLSGVTP